MTEPLQLSDFKCDYHRSCVLLPFAEVIYSETHESVRQGILETGTFTWSYLCLPHFIQEVVVRRRKVGWCLADWLTRIPLVRRLWNWWAK